MLLRGGVILVLLLLQTSCRKTDTPKPASDNRLPAREVRVASAKLQPMERALRVVGTLAAHDEATIAAQVAGQLEKIFVDLGDRIGAGQEISEIDTTSYEALANASAANLSRAKANAENAAQNLKRTQELQKDKIASASDLDAATAEDAASKAEVQAAAANDAVARLNLSRSHVKAPFPGVIAQRIASAGDYLAIGAPIVRLVQTDPLRLRLEVPERESPAVQLGQAVRVMVEGDTNIYRGQLTRIAPAIRSTDRMLIVEADVPNSGNLRAGLFARATIVIDAAQPVLSVPADSLTAFAGLEKVVLLKDGKAIEKNVTTGRRENGWIEITSGLEVGASVVLEPAGIRTGQPLAVPAQSTLSVATQTNAPR